MVESELNAVRSGRSTVEHENPFTKKFKQATCLKLSQLVRDLPTLDQGGLLN